MHDAAVIVAKCLLQELGGHFAIKATGDSSDDLGLIVNNLPDPRSPPG